MVTLPISMMSSMPMMKTRLVSLKRLMNCETIGGMMFRSA